MIPQHRWAWQLWATSWAAVNNMLNKIYCDSSIHDLSSLTLMFQHPMFCANYGSCYSHGGISLGLGRSGAMKCRQQWRVTSLLGRMSTRPICTFQVAAPLGLGTD